MKLKKQFTANCKLLMLVAVLACLSLSACNNEKWNNKGTLNRAAKAVESNPRYACDLLKLTHLEDLNKDDYHYYILLQLRAWDLQGINIAIAEKEALEARDYFSKKQDGNKAAFACFLTAKVYEELGKPEDELQNYFMANEWADKSGNQLLAIPYNLAVALYDKGKYEESLYYLDKTLQQTQKLQRDRNYDYSYELYSLELKAVNHQFITNIDSALFYYDKALELADKYNHTDSKIRIGYSRTTIFINTKDFEFAEKECRRMLIETPIDDKRNLGLLYMSLAAIYNKTDRNDSAYMYIYKAKDFLLKFTDIDYYTEFSLYEKLSKIEESRGNLTQAEKYKKHYENLASIRAERNKTELTVLQAELNKVQNDKANVMLQLTEKIRTAEKQKKTRAILAFIAIIIVAIVLWILFRIIKTVKFARATYAERISNLVEVARIELFRIIFQRRDWAMAKEYLIEDAKKDAKAKELIDRVDNISPVTSDDAFQIYSKEFEPYFVLFDKLSIDFPMLTELEYRVLCLICARVEPFDIADFLGIDYSDESEYRKILISIRKKLQAEGFNLSKEIRDARKTIPISGRRLQLV